MINTNGDIRKFIMLTKQNSIFYIGKAKYAEQDFKEMFGGEIQNG